MEELFERFINEREMTFSTLKYILEYFDKMTSDRAKNIIYKLLDGREISNLTDDDINEMVKKFNDENKVYGPIITRSLLINTTFPELV